jgi:hypothetical protein
LRHRAKKPKVYSPRHGKEGFPLVAVRPDITADYRGFPLTSSLRIGMIRGLICLLFPKSFEELDGGQLTFRQKTCKTG